MAICTLASVPFLHPTGIERPDASSRWPWLSVVRAPMAPRVTRPLPSCAACPDRAAPLSAWLRGAPTRAAPKGRGFFLSTVLRQLFERTVQPQLAAKSSNPLNAVTTLLTQGAVRTARYGKDDPLEHLEECIGAPHHSLMHTIVDVAV